MKRLEAPLGYMTLRDASKVMRCSLDAARLRIRRRLLGGALRLPNSVVVVPRDAVLALALNPPKRGTPPKVKVVEPGPQRPRGGQRKTHCKYCHSLDGALLYKRKDDGRQMRICRVCQQDRLHSAAFLDMWRDIPTYQAATTTPAAAATATPTTAASEVAK